MTEAQLMMLTPAEIRRDGQTQIRIEINAETISRYELMIKQADYEWPFTDPLVVFSDGEEHWLADGFQRDIAWQNVFNRPGQEIPSYPVELRAGTLRDAIRYATHEANRHGQPYTRKDRRNLARLLIEDVEWRQYSNRQIARIAGLDEKTIRNIRKELAADVESQIEEPSEEIVTSPITVESSVDDAGAKTFNATVAPIEGADFPHLEQIAMFEAEPAPPWDAALALPAIYAPVEAHQIVHLQTPLACTIIDTEKLALCGKPATVAFAWLMEDQIEGALWRLRPVCGGCVALGNQ
ncbi:MAG: hypothetical protein KDE19_05570 [Caldilineaceae bacterium]|nr:hypothetical protein [Caldilineaceae bacterium]